ncbi:MAG: hypothetical protein N4A68_09265 [Maledivibacter sp.]|nr:hypothetical protein [Maledivibacter sp.]
MKNTRVTLERFIIIIYIIFLVLSYFVNYKYMYIDFFIVTVFMGYSHIIKLIFGPQYKIRKNMKCIYKKYKKKDILDLVEDIRKYYDKNYFSTDELLSRKYELEKNFDIDQNILLGCFSGIIVALMFFQIDKGGFVEILDRDIGTIGSIVGVIIMGIFISIIPICILIFLYLVYLIPNVSRSSKHYLRKRELEILIEKLNERLKEKRRENCF